MDVRQMIACFLKSAGYDGLFEAEECACKLGDLMPCDSEAALSCEPGYIYPAEDDSEFAFMIGRRDSLQRGGCERAQELVVTGSSINARAFYLAMIDRSIEAAMEADRIYHLAAHAYHIEKCPSRGSSYMKTCGDLSILAGQWRFYARMWAIKWSVVHAPAPPEWK